MIYTIAGALTIGMIIGLLGSGGSVVTVPVLVYVVGHSPKAAISESLAIVGIISLVASIPYAFRKRVDWASVLWFGLPGIAGTIIGAWLGGRAADSLQLGFFSVVLLLTASVMIRNLIVDRTGEGDVREKPDSDAHNRAHRGFWRQGKKILEGLAVGVLTGFVGVGGGFMIVPALAILGGLSMQMAVGTSLVIIFLKSIAGFAKYQQQLIESGTGVDWGTIALFTMLGIVASLVGQKVNSMMKQRTLSLVFTIFLMVTGLFVLYQEGSKLLRSDTDGNGEIRSVEKS
jgi:uncharacterized protein